MQHSLDALLRHPDICGAVIALAAEDRHWRKIDRLYGKPVLEVVGGRERTHSVISALRGLTPYAAADDWVLVHDAARCCVQSANIDELISALKNDEVGGILAVPASDTLKQVNSELHIAATLDRQTVWQAQTPQMFRYGLLREALQQAQDHERAVTDEASALELAGYRPKVIMGRHDNIKITHREDLAIAAAILKQQGKQ